jgi:hypothetical protein
MQEIRWFRPSTVSRRFFVTAGSYRTFVLDDIIEHLPAEHVSRPAVPAESPTLGFTHLQFEVVLTRRPGIGESVRLRTRGTARPADLRVTSADIADLGEEHGHRVLCVCGKGTKVILVLLPPAVGQAIDGPQAPGTGGRSC